jgi:hypothetical protein
MLSSPVYVKLHPRHASSAPSAFSVPSALNPIPKARHRSIARHRAPISPFLIHPLCFQTLPHSFAQWTTPISFPFNRFHTLSIVMGGGGYPAAKNLNRHFNSSSNSQRISSQSPHFSSFPFKGLRTLSFSVLRKSCICHPYENTGGVYQLFPNRNSVSPRACACPLRAGQYESQQRNKRSPSFRNGGKFRRNCSAEIHGEFGADYRVQFNDSLGKESRGLLAVEESDPVAAPEKRACFVPAAKRQERKPSPA